MPKAEKRWPRGRIPGSQITSYSEEQKKQRKILMADVRHPRAEADFWYYAVFCHTCVQPNEIDEPMTALEWLARHKGHNTEIREVSPTKPPSKTPFQEWFDRWGYDPLAVGHHFTPPTENQPVTSRRVVGEESAARYMRAIKEAHFHLDAPDARELAESALVYNKKQYMYQLIKPLVLT